MGIFHQVFALVLTLLSSTPVNAKGSLVETWRVDTGQMLYPEGIAYDAERNRIIVGSMVSPSLATFDVANNMTHLVTYTRDGAVAGLSNLGLALDPNMPDRIWCAQGSLMTFDLGRVDAYDISPPADGSKEAVADAVFGQSFVCQNADGGTGCGVGNDLIVAEDGFVYVTDTALGRVFSVDSTTGAPIEEVVSDPMLVGTASPFGANGILYHPSGYLIIANTGGGALFRFDLETKELSKIGLEKDIAPDGLLFLPDGRLVMVSASTSLVVLSDAGDDWKNAVVDDEVDINFMQDGELATTIALGASDLEVYVTFVRFGEVQTGSVNAGPSLIGKVVLEKASSSDSTSEEPPSDSSSEPSSESPPSDLPDESSDAPIKQHMGLTFSISLISFLLYILF